MIRSSDVYDLVAGVNASYASGGYWIPNKFATELLTRIQRRIKRECKKHQRKRSRRKQ